MRLISLVVNNAQLHVITFLANRLLMPQIIRTAERKQKADMVEEIGVAVGIMLGEFIAYPLDNSLCAWHPYFIIIQIQFCSLSHFELFHCHNKT